MRSEPTYTERVARGLEGLEAVSTGPCLDCDECRESYGYFVRECDSSDDECYVADSPHGHTRHATESEALAASREQFESDCSACIVDAEPRFSWSGCGICGSTLGGYHEKWHARDSRGQLFHFDDACMDCVFYIENGDVPDGEE